jgi:hypothetical protein
MYARAHRHADTDPWVERAACRNTDPETFFPPAGKSDGSDPEAAAKRVCARCPVTGECLREALLHEESTGIWGGLNVRERRELLRIAASLRTMSAELASFLANGGRHVRAQPRERPAYVWFLRRQGWGPHRIAGALGLTLSQVQQAWRTAEFAASCTQGPPPAQDRPPRRRVRRARTASVGHGRAS